jgi:Raf kinase inhibitor-like YbhB/YbcL family protein
MALALTSTAFRHGEAIPKEFTCDGKDISPPLHWSGVPHGTQSLVLIVDDPDAPDPAAPKMTWVHWIVYNMSTNRSGLPEGAGPADLPEGGVTGRNNWGRAEYGGPCPPVGRHRYFHKLYALDIELPNIGAATKGEIEQMMSGHVLAEAQLMGTYQRD